MRPIERAKNRKKIRYSPNSTRFTYFKVEMLFDSIILSLIKKKNLTKKDVDEAKRMFASEHKRATIPSNSKLIRTYRKLLATGKIQAHHELERILTKRAVRSLS